MKFVLFCSYFLGLALPTLETYRRGFDHWLVNSMTMAGDYLMGAALLMAAISFTLKKAYGNLLLVMAWCYVLGVMNAAFWGHLEGHLRGITQCDNPPDEVNAIIVKGIIWIIALASIVISVKSLRKNTTVTLNN